MNSAGKISMRMMQLFVIAFLLCVNLTNTITAQVIQNSNPENKTVLDFSPDTAGINALLLLGEEKFNGFSIDSTIVIFQNIVRSSSIINYNRGIVLSYVYLAKCYIEKADYDSSMLYARQALLAARAPVANGKYTALVYELISKIYLLKSDYPYAAFYCYKACQHIQEPNARNFYLLSQIYSTLFFCSERLGLKEASTYYLNLQEHTALLTKDSARIAWVYSNKGCSYFAAHDWDNAERYFLHALGITSRNNINLDLQTTIAINLADIYAQRKNPRLSLQYAQKAVALAERTNSVWGRIGAYYILGQSYFELKNNKLAERNVLHAVELAEPLGYFDNITTAYEILANIYKSSGQYEKALTYHYIKDQIRDSIINIRKFQNLGELEIKYKTAEKDKNIAEKELLISGQENKLREKNTWIGGISAGVIFLITLTGLLYRNNKHKQRLQQEQIARLQQEQHIEKLEATIRGEEKERARMARELHDGIVGQLAAVKWNLNNAQKEYDMLSHVPHFQDAVTQLDEATAELRNTAHNLLPGIIEEQELADAVAYFCKKMTKSSGLPIDFHVSGEMPVLDPGFKLSVYRMIQELVQNVIKHAKATHALVQIDCQDTLLIVTVEDNGTGFDKNKIKSQGIGLKTIPERIKAMHGQYHLESNGEGTSVHLEFDTAIFKYH